MIERSALSSPGSTTAPSERPRSIEEAARQFEQVLVRQFVDVMTENLFDGGLSGDQGPAWIGGQRDMQRDTLNDVLTHHLAEAGTLRLRDLLLQKWGRAQAAGPAEATDPPAAPLGRADAKHLSHPADNDT